MNNGDYQYVGDELVLFGQARNWKRYLSELILPHLGQSVLEVGAGLGETASVLCPTTVDKWVCLEPDIRFVEVLQSKVAVGLLAPACEVMHGTIAMLAKSQFETILYVDVLEHIEQDAAELEMAATQLFPGGKLIILAPAHNRLFSPFDRQVGHYRRYDKNMLVKALPESLMLLESKYLDSAGILLSLMNKLLLRQSEPTLRQIRFWDRFILPVSKLLDPLFRFRLGKSILLIAQKQ